MDRIGEPPSAREARFTVLGRVQGVGYRWFVREAATRLGLAGWVRNEPDGSVVAEASGSRAAIDEFARALATGPAGARVARVDESLRSSTDRLPDRFLIVR